MSAHLFRELTHLYGWNNRNSNQRARINAFLPAPLCRCSTRSNNDVADDGWTTDKFRERLRYINIHNRYRGKKKRREFSISHPAFIDFSYSAFFHFFPYWSWIKSGGSFPLNVNKRYGKRENLSSKGHAVFMSIIHATSIKEAYSIYSSCVTQDNQSSGWAAGISLFLQKSGRLLRDHGDHNEIKFFFSAALRREVS